MRTPFQKGRRRDSRKLLYATKIEKFELVQGIKRPLKVLCAIKVNVLNLLHIAIFRGSSSRTFQVGT